MLGKLQFVCLTTSNPYHLNVKYGRTRLILFRDQQRALSKIVSTATQYFGGLFHSIYFFQLIGKKKFASGRPPKPLVIRQNSI
jgi:hypothetical protein